MARNRLPGSKIIVAVGLGFALFIVAIIARSFWLSLVIGIAGGITLAYAVFLLREFRKVGMNVPRSGYVGNTAPELA